MKDLYWEIKAARDFLSCIDMIYKSTLPAMNINSISLAPHAADRAAENHDRRRAGERHQLVGHQVDEQVRHRAVQALEGEPGKVA